MSTDFTLFQPLLQGSAQLEPSLRKLLWPAYRRQTVAMGGDFGASSQFSGPDWLLEKWRDEYLGAHFIETWAGVTAFEGQLYAMQLTYNGQFQTVSLENVYNSVTVKYLASTKTSEAETAAATDSDSIALYGTRELYIDTTSDLYMPVASAEAYRDALLARYSWPRVFAEEINWSGGPGVLQIEIRGYVRTLNGQRITNTSTSFDDADDEINDALSGADFVSAGSIATNTLQVTEEAEQQPAWDRIRKIAQLGDSAGDRWLAGCYQGRELDYWEPDIDAVSYFYDAKARRPERRRVMYSSDGGEVPAALVQPGRIAFARDMMPGVPVASPLIDDPRAMFIERVDYSPRGLALKGAPIDDIIAPPNPAQFVKIALKEAAVRKDRVEVGGRRKSARGGRGGLTAGT